MLARLVEDIAAMAPTADETPPALMAECHEVMQGHGVEVSAGVERVYAVFKCNAFEGGIYPHMARLNHSCNPSCRYRYKNGRIEAWARRPIEAGEEVTISYRNCESRFPGSPPTGVPLASDAWAWWKDCPGMSSPRGRRASAIITSSIVAATSA
jgi:hypothetical protein